MKGCISYGTIQTSDDIINTPTTTTSCEQSSYLYGSINEDSNVKDSQDLVCMESRQTHWRTIRVLYITVFISSTATSITYASEWPYLKTVDPSASTTFLSWIVAGQNMAQVMASPLLSSWINQNGKIRNVLLVSLMFSICGMLLYAYCWHVSLPKSYSMLVSKVMTGIGSASVPLVWSYASSSTENTDRTHVIAYIGAWQSAGVFCGPVFQILFVFLGYPGVIHTSWLHLDQFTAPAFFSVLLNILNIVIVVTFIKEARQETFDDRHMQQVELAGYDWVAMMATLLLYFSATFVFCIFGETIGTPFTMALYGWIPSKATFYNGIIFALQGVVSSLVYLLTIYFINKTNEKLVISTGFILMILGVAVMFPWRHTHPVKQVSTEDILLSSYQVTRGHESEACSEYNWCKHTPKIYIGQYVMGSFAITIGFSLTKVVAYTIYSNLMGTGKQGVLMGILTSFGSLARSLSPIYVNIVFMKFGPAPTFGTICVLLVVTITCNACINKCFRRPSSQHAQIEEEMQPCLSFN